jgi:hypothetical protein
VLGGLDGAPQVAGEQGAGPTGRQLLGRGGGLLVASLGQGHVRRLTLHAALDVPLALPVADEQQGEGAVGAVPMITGHGDRSVGEAALGPCGRASYRRPVTIPVRPGAARPESRPAAQDPLAHLLDLPGVRDAADAARTGIDRLLAHRLMRNRSAEVSTESALRGARASAALEGVDVPLAELRAGAVDDPVVQGSLRVSAALGSMSETWSRAPGQVLARLHVLAAADLVDRTALGRPAAHAGPRLAGLFGLVKVETTVPAVLVAALVHGELAAMAPFGTADGVVARAAARLTGITRGLDPKAVSVPEVGFVELGREAYGTALAGYTAGSPEGVAGWLVHCCRATEHGALEGLAIAEAILRG